MALCSHTRSMVSESSLETSCPEKSPCHQKQQTLAEAGEVSVGSVATPARSTRASDKAPSELSLGNRIRVAVRVRPVPPGDDSIIEVAGEGAIAIRKEAGTGGNEFLRSQQGRTEERSFDRVFGPNATQEEIYMWSCQPLVRSAVTEGRSATVFVYGATGAGKTHTMFGKREEAQQGLICRAIREVFAAVSDYSKQLRSKQSMEVKVSFLDIYNESVRDLLQDSGSLCKVLEDERRGVVKVTNLREVLVRSSDEAIKQLHAGMQGRKVEATAANLKSSRSHAVFSMTLEQVGPAPRGPGDPIFQRHGTEPRHLHSRICLIDLAGSERATQTKNEGQALKDGAKINQSLLALANCIDALVAKNVTINSGGSERAQTPRRKPPYRDSKLTLLLKGSLTSDCIVSMIANVHPGRDHFEDSNNTLEYAKRASIVKAPILVRRTRATSLLSASPPGSPRSTSSSFCEVAAETSPQEASKAAGLAIAAAGTHQQGRPCRSQSGRSLHCTTSPTTRALSTPRTDSRLRQRRSVEVDATSSTATPLAAPCTGPRLRRRQNAEVEATSLATSALPTPRTDSRPRRHKNIEVEAASFLHPAVEACAVSAGSGTRPCPAVNETVRKSPSPATSKDQGRVASAAVASSTAPQQQPCATSIQQETSHSSVGKARSSGQRHLSRCSESPIEEASSSFDTASPGVSSTTAVEDAARPSSPHLAPSSDAASSSSSGWRETSPLELTPRDEDHGATSTSDSELRSQPEDAQCLAAQAHLLDHSDRSTSVPASALNHESRSASESVERIPAVQGSCERPPRQVASPLPVRSRKQQARGAPSSSPSCQQPVGPPSATASQSAALLLRLVDSLQSEKSALDERLHQVSADRERLEADNARLRAANLEKDRQLALFLGSHPANAHESIAACSSCLSGSSSKAVAMP